MWLKEQLTASAPFVKQLIQYKRKSHELELHLMFAEQDFLMKFKLMLSVSKQPSCIAQQGCHLTLLQHLLEQEINLKCLLQRGEQSLRATCPHQVVLKHQVRSTRVR